MAVAHNRGFLKKPGCGERQNEPKEVVPSPRGLLFLRKPCTKISIICFFY